MWGAAAEALEGVLQAADEILGGLLVRGLAVRLAAVVSSRQVCMNRFKPCGIVGCQHTDLWGQRLLAVNAKLPKSRSPVPPPFITNRHELAILTVSFDALQRGWSALHRCCQKSLVQGTRWKRSASAPRRRRRTSRCPTPRCRR